MTAGPQDNRSSRRRWAKITIPTIVILAVVVLVCWRIHDTTLLPVVKDRTPCIVDRSVVTINVTVNRTGRLLVDGRGLTLNELGAVLDKATDKYREPVPCEIRADARASWSQVQPVLQLLITRQYRRVDFGVRRDGEGSLFVGALLAAPATETLVEIRRTHGILTADGKACTTEQLSSLASLGTFLHGHALALVCDPTDLVQDCMELLDFCSSLGRVVLVTPTLQAEGAQH